MLDCFVCLCTICRFNNSTHERYCTHSQAVNKGLGRTIESPQIVTTDQSDQKLKVSLCFVKNRINNIKSFYFNEFVNSGRRVSKVMRKTVALQGVGKRYKQSFLQVTQVITTPVAPPKHEGRKNVSALCT